MSATVNFAVLADLHVSSCSLVASYLKEMKLDTEVCNQVYIIICTDPPDHGRLGGHYFHPGCPSVRPSQKQEHVAKLKLATGKQNNGHHACRY